MKVPQSQSKNLGTLKKLEKLSDQLDAAKHTSETTTKEVQRAQRTTDHVEHDLRLRHNSNATKGKPERSKDRRNQVGKSKAAVELGRKGGAATAKILTPQQRSALAVKAARARWNTQ